MLSRYLLTCLPLLLLGLPADGALASPPAAPATSRAEAATGPAAPETAVWSEAEDRRVEALHAALAPLDAEWTRVLERLRAGSRSTEALTPKLSPSLSDALVRLEPALASGELSPHRVGAGLCAVVRETARSAGALPGELMDLESALREFLPPLLERDSAPRFVTGAFAQGLLASGLDLNAAQFAALLGPAPQRERSGLVEGYCELRPERCGDGALSSLETWLPRLVRASGAPGLPGELALTLRAELSPTAAEAPR